DLIGRIAELECAQEVLDSTLAHLVHHILNAKIDWSTISRLYRIRDTPKGSQIICCIDMCECNGTTRTMCCSRNQVPLGNRVHLCAVEARTVGGEFVRRHIETVD